jgi:hypothetical protein
MSRNAAVNQSVGGKKLENMLNIDDLSNIDSGDLENMMDQLDQEMFSESEAMVEGNENKSVFQSSFMESISFEESNHTLK